MAETKTEERTQQERVARDIMIPIEEYASVNSNDSLKQAILELKKSIPYGHRTLAVIDNEKNLTGFLTIRTILKTLEVTAFRDNTDWALSWGGYFLKRDIEHLSKLKVKEVARPVVKVYVEENTPLREVARVILKTQVNNIPVVDAGRKVTGIIRAADVLDIFASFL